MLSLVLQAEDASALYESIVKKEGTVIGAPSCASRGACKRLCECKGEPTVTSSTSRDLVEASGWSSLSAARHLPGGNEPTGFKAAQRGVDRTLRQALVPIKQLSTVQLTAGNQELQYAKPLMS